MGINILVNGQILRQTVYLYYEYKKYISLATPLAGSLCILSALPSILGILFPTAINWKDDKYKTVYLVKKQQVQALHLVMQGIPTTQKQHSHNHQEYQNYRICPLQTMYMEVCASCHTAVHKATTSLHLLHGTIQILSSYCVVI